MSKNLPPAEKRERHRVKVEFTEPSLTKQSFREECNINSIMARYEKTGLINHVVSRQPIFGDFSEIPDYQTALNIVYTAEDQFLQLPAQLRKFFNNDPSFMLAYMQDPKNKAMCQKLGLLPQDTKPIKSEAEEPPKNSEALKSGGTPAPDTPKT